MERPLRYISIILVLLPLMLMPFFATDAEAGGDEALHNFSGLQSLIAACNRGQAAACANLAVDYHSDSHGLDQDLEQAEIYYGKACKLGETMSCKEQLGLRSLSRDRVERERRVEREQRNLENLTDACNADEAQSCMRLGIVYGEGEGVDIDHERAAALFEKSCDGEDAAGCRHLGLRYLSGEGVTTDTERTVQLFEKACDAEDAQSCSYLGDLYSLGHLVEQDYGQAVTLLRRACNLDSTYGCSNLAKLYERGDGVEQDYEKSADFYEMACDAGDVNACSTLGVSLVVGEVFEVDYERAEGPLKYACKREDANGCWGLGHLTIGKNGEGKYLDALRIFVRSCDYGSGEACLRAAILMLNGTGSVAEKPEAAIWYFSRACNKGNGRGCAGRGLMHRNELVDFPDSDRAEESFEQGCKLGSVLSCILMNESYRPYPKTVLCHRFRSWEFCEH